MQTNALYYGDNLSILRDFVPSDSVDLVYLDPPFNSQRDYNLIFKDQSGNKADAQILAFEDTWTWGPSAATQFDYLTNSAHHHGKVPGQVGQIIAALRSGLGANRTDGLPGGDDCPTPSAPPGAEADGFAVPALRSDREPLPQGRPGRDLRSALLPQRISWKRFSGKNNTKRFGRTHDVILYYTKSNTYTWNVQYGPFEQDYVAENYRYVEEGSGRRYRRGDLTANKPGGDVDYEWHGMLPYRGRHWAYSKDNMEKMLADGRIEFRSTGMPVYKRYLDEQPGVPLQDIWTDIRLHGGSKERLGWDTQKPLALLERILIASTKPGDLVLDPFCGCGTALVAAQSLQESGSASTSPT